MLLFLDVGGSMDPHVQVCEELFSAAKSEFRHLEYFYFHNCVYDHVWRDNRRRRNERIATFDLLHKYGRDWKLIFVGDAAMSPYELVQPGGSVEYANDEPGAAWLQRLIAAYRHAIWLNPEPERTWQYTRSTQIVQELARAAHVSADARRPAARHRGAAKIALPVFKQCREAPVAAIRRPPRHARPGPARPASRR